MNLVHLAATLVRGAFVWLLVATAGCAHTPPAPPATAQWTYPEGQSWGEACLRTRPPQQSPIDLQHIEGKPWPATVVTQATFDAHDQNVVFAPSLGPSVTISPAIDPSVSPRTYAVAGYHFHAGPEHLVPGDARIEMHIKTTDQAGHTAVFAVLWENGGTVADPTLAAVLQSLRTPTAGVDVGRLLYRFSQEPFYSYEGSLTTPPCTTGIRWYVLKAPIRTTPESITDLVNALVTAHKPPDNRRRVRPLQTEVFLVTPQ